MKARNKLKQMVEAELATNNISVKSWKTNETRWMNFSGRARAVQPCTTSACGKGFGAKCGHRASVRSHRPQGRAGCWWSAFLRCSLQDWSYYSSQQATGPDNTVNKNNIPQTEIPSNGKFNHNHTGNGNWQGFICKHWQIHAERIIQKINLGIGYQTEFCDQSFKNQGCWRPASYRCGWGNSKPLW